MIISVNIQIVNASYYSDILCHYKLTTTYNGTFIDNNKNNKDDRIESIPQEYYPTNDTDILNARLEYCKEMNK